MSVLYPKVSVITVCYNSQLVIEETIKSVVGQDYPNLEYIIIDGGSNDSTLDIIKKYKDKVDIMISEPDDGVYNAMNKGIDLATGIWLNFMNAGDCFADPCAKRVFSNPIPDDKSFLYSDAWLKYENRLVPHITSIDEGVVLHQACLYKKELHSRYGYYNEFKPIVISDYLFFCNVPLKLFYKIENEKIAIYDMTGISTQKWNYQQKLCADVIFSRKTMSHLIVKILFGNIVNLVPAKIRGIVKQAFFRK